MLQIPVRRGDTAQILWFKATCRGFHDEPAITAAVRAFAGPAVPQVLAVDTGRAWMLMAAFPEEEDGPVEIVPIARTLARLQLASLAQLPALEAAGAVVRDAAATTGWLRDLVAESVELPLMTQAQRDAAEELLPWLTERVTAFFATGYPLALVHGDLHAGNTTLTADGPLLFDWTDACLSHPCLDIRHLAASATTDDPDPEATSAQIHRAWRTEWARAFPQADHDSAWRLSRIAEPAFTLVSYEKIYRAQPVDSRWELATVVVELLDRLAQLRADEARPAPVTPQRPAPSAAD